MIEHLLFDNLLPWHWGVFLPFQFQTSNSLEHDNSAVEVLKFGIGIVSIRFFLEELQHGCFGAFSYLVPEAASKHGHCRILYVLLFSLWVCLTIPKDAFPYLHFDS